MGFKTLKRKFSVAVGVAAAGLAASPAQAQIGVALYGGRGMAARLSNGGHAAVYLKNVCPDGMTKVRKCNPGEDGSVISRYSNWGESPDGKPLGFDWAAVPARVHFYGTEKADDVPLVATMHVMRTVKEDYRQKKLSEMVRAPKEGEWLTPGQWQHMIGVSSIRGVDVVVLETTPEEDQELIESFNTDDNKAKFSFVLRNCSDFAKNVLNTVFEGAAARSPKDFGMTSPTSVHKGANKVGRKNPDRLMRYDVIQQIPGTATFDSKPRTAMDNAWSTLQYAPLLAYYQPYYFAGMTAMSMIGRYNKDKERKKYPNLEVAQMRLKLDELKDEKKALQDCDSCRANGAGVKVQLDALEASIEALDQEIKDRIKEIDTQHDDDFEAYRQKFSKVIDDALAKGLIDETQAKLLRKKDKPQEYLKLFESNAKSVMDPTIGLTLTVTAKGKTRTTGVTQKNIESGDKSLAFEVMLGAVNYMLDVPKKDRVTLEQFEINWNTLSRLGSSLGIDLASR